MGDLRFIASPGHVKPPDILYKYYTVERAIQVLATTSVWISAPSDFNDPYDSRLRFENPKGDREKREFGKAIAIHHPGLSGHAERRRWEKTLPTDDSLYEETANRLRNELRNTTGVACLSERRDCLLMFAHYAKNHQGVCIGFSTTDDSRLKNAHKIAYGDQVPTINLVDITTNDAPESAGALLRKARCWEYEAEWRLVLADRTRFLLGLRSADIRSVIIGAEARSDTLARLREAARQSGAAPKFFRSRLSSTQFKLDITQVDNSASAF